MGTHNVAHIPRMLPELDGATLSGSLRSHADGLRDLAARLVDGAVTPNSARHELELMAHRIDRTDDAVSRSLGIAQRPIPCVADDRPNGLWDCSCDECAQLQRDADVDLGGEA